MNSEKTTIDMRYQSEEQNSQIRYVNLALTFKQNIETFYSVQSKRPYGEKGPKTSQRPFMFLRPYMNSPHLKLLQRRKNLPIIAKNELHQMSSQKNRNVFDFIESNNYINMSDVIELTKPESPKYSQTRNSDQKKMIQLKNQYICKIKPPNTLTNFTINQKLAIQRRKTLSIPNNNEMILEKSHRVKSMISNELNSIPANVIASQDNIINILKKTHINFDDVGVSEPISQDKFFVRENNFRHQQRSRKTN